MATSASPNVSQSPFDFAPQPTQDVELLKQLSYVPGLKEILMLRQVHALEHATVWVLGDSPNLLTSRQASYNQQIDYESLGGMSTAQGFYLYGSVDTEDLRRAVQIALRRIIKGEWDLAVHPRCGTNFSVNMLLTAGLALGTHLLLPRGPLEQLFGFGLAMTAAAQIAPDVGGLVQRYVTTAIPFNLEIANITVSQDYWGQTVHFVQVRWAE